MIREQFQVYPKYSLKPEIFRVYLDYSRSRHVPPVGSREAPHEPEKSRRGGERGKTPG
ncbi:hypothetical protein HMPREF9278_1987 [Mobiluncus mulieris FB024-16]|nr:hypothetical protein HMPREF9278_1987 [Mobiluncus mulieris FB024-16]